MDGYMTILLKSTAAVSAVVAALVIDEKTGISIGTMIVVVSAVWYMGRKFQEFLDRFSSLDKQFGSLDEFMDESRKWRKNLAEEQDRQKQVQDQILRHQEQAKIRHEMILKDMGAIREARELYAELMTSFQQIKDHLKIETAQFAKKDIHPKI